MQIYNQHAQGFEALDESRSLWQLELGKAWHLIHAKGPYGNVWETWHAACTMLPKATLHASCLFSTPSPIRKQGALTWNAIGTRWTLPGGIGPRNLDFHCARTTYLI